MKKQAINLGRIGILLPIATIIPIINFFVGIAVIVLLLLSHYHFSKHYNNPAIFKNALTGFIVQVISVLVGSIILGVAIGSAAVGLSSGGGIDPANIQNITGLLFENGATIIGGLVMLVGLIIGFYFFGKSLKLLAQHTGVKHFKTAGMLYFIGAIGIIIFFIGSIIIFIGWIMHIIAYFTVQPEEAFSEKAAV
ncbi:DUF996 domain-containing protein [Thermophagus xiamenensis]|uniref:Uncharacterized membrane protein n=1 Tax=Thermophagus xiamenensis TaxID=385682 RepID=A0A1I2BRE6_9BACT|nr:DUF996 domain-containing protein [Thermophagus xiamenensis]SFE58736.1 Uncharacterized membrane protein [Thermophagus xiamenensis]